MKIDQHADIKQSEGLSAIWWVPIIALLLGLWMAYDHVSNQGPVIQISFDTAEGLEAGKTKIKTLNVDIGVVESVKLNADFQGVVVQARLDKEVASLLKDDTHFWVVRPRIGKAGVSGLGTLLSGAYIELSPGKSDTLASAYRGLEDIPLTASGTPGLAMTLVSENKQSLSVGDPIIYHGFNVGQVESAEFDPSTRRAHYRLFVRAPYNNLITSNTRFWNVSGVQVETSAEGININTGSLETLLAGGVTFGVMAGGPLGEEVSANVEFELYDSQKTAFEPRYQYYAEYLLLLEDSVRGLKAGAVVEYRGIRLGAVLAPAVLGMEQTGDKNIDSLIPVLIKLEPARIGYPDTKASVALFEKDFKNWIASGMSAQLTTGSLLTGKQFVDLNFHDKPAQTALKKRGGYTVIPASSGGFGQITAKVEGVLDKVNALSLEPVLVNAAQTLKEMKATLRTLEGTLVGLNSDSSSYLEATETLRSLRAALREVKPLLSTLNKTPSALVFGASSAPDLEPGPKARP